MFSNKCKTTQGLGDIGLNTYGPIQPTAWPLCLATDGLNIIRARKWHYFLRTSQKVSISTYNIIGSSQNVNKNAIFDSLLVLWSLPSRLKCHCAAVYDNVSPLFSGLERAAFETYGNNNKGSSSGKFKHLWLEDKYASTLNGLCIQVFKSSCIFNLLRIKAYITPLKQRCKSGIGHHIFIV